MTLPHSFGLSTAWNGGRHTSPAALLDEHLALGFRRAELYCHWTPDQLADLAREAWAREIEVTSLHSPCPIPTSASGARDRWGDWLASTHEPDRSYAVDCIKRTIDAAAEVGARAVVIHLGTTGYVSRQRQIFETIAREGRNSDAHRRLVDEAWREREARKAPTLEAALKSIRALGEHAAGTPVSLGVECRDGYQEIPSLDEVEDVLGACDGLPVYYWHDAGHGAKLQNAGFLEHEEYLRRYADRMLGMHIHDTIAERDHLAPGTGETDLAMVTSYLKPGMVLTLELRATVEPADVGRAVELLKGLGITWTE